MSYKGKFKPKRRDKYEGDSTDIIYRSLKERSIMVFLDSSDKVLKWGSETVVIKYLYGVDNKIHRYFVDFYVEMICKDGSIKKLILEYKPKIQTLPPKEAKNKTHAKSKRRYLKESLVYIKNMNKWEAAVNYAKKNSMEFYVISEADVKNMQFFYSI
jgi:hypothetical protein